MSDDNISDRYLHYAINRGAGQLKHDNASPSFPGPTRWAMEGYAPRDTITGNYNFDTADLRRRGASSANANITGQRHLTQYIMRSGAGSDN